MASQLSVSSCASSSSSALCLLSLVAVRARVRAGGCVSRTDADQSITSPGLLLPFPRCALAGELWLRRGLLCITSNTPEITTSGMCP